jgi:hypothetical protein
MINFGQAGRSTGGRLPLQYTNAADSESRDGRNVHYRLTYPGPATAARGAEPRLIGLSEGRLSGSADYRSSDWRGWQTSPTDSGLASVSPYQSRKAESLINHICILPGRERRHARNAAALRANIPPRSRSVELAAMLNEAFNRDGEQLVTVRTARVDNGRRIVSNHRFRPISTPDTTLPR